jgi:flagellar hook-length control protein FliK
MAQLNSPVLNATVSGRSETVSTNNVPGSASSAGGERNAVKHQGFAEMMAGAIQNQTQNASATGASGRSQTAVVSKADIMEQVNAVAGHLSGEINGQQVVSTLQQQIDALQEKIQTLTNQNPPLSDAALAALNTLTQQLASLKSRLGAEGGSTALDVSSLSKWMAQLEKLQTLLKQGDVNAEDWAGQLQAMAQHLAQMNGQTAASLNADQGRAGIRAAVSDANSTAQVAHQAASDAKRTSSGPAVNASAETAQTLDQTKKDNSSAANQVLSQNNPTVSAGRNSVSTLSGLMGTPPSAQTASGHSTLNAMSNAESKSDLVMQLADSSSDKSTGTFNLSSSGFGAAANSSSGVSLPGTLALNQPRVAADLGQNIQFMVGKNISRATLDVNPAHLGPMKITIDQQNNQTNIQIMATHHLAKDMLDQNMPRLREWLQDAGLGNAQVTVMSGGQDGANNQAMNQGSSEDFGSSAGGHGASADTAATTSQSGATRGVDTSENRTETVSARLRLDTFA